MEEYTTNKILITVISIILGINSCKSNKHEGKISPTVISQSINLILKDKRYQRNISRNIKIERNDLTENIQPFKLDTFNIEMINKIEENDTVFNHASSFYFYKYAKISGGDVEVEFTIYPSKKYVKFCFSKDKLNKWKLVDREDWQF